MDKEKSVDESWKDSIEQEKTELQNVGDGEQGGEETGEINFLNYISSLIFQAMIFLGQMPNPMAENTVERNLPQAKLLIDTLVLLRDKTKGNLTKEEEDFLNSSLYELQVQFIEQSKNELQGENKHD